jgi:hypothetical protein
MEVFYIEVQRYFHTLWILIESFTYFKLFLLLYHTMFNMSYEQ